MDKTRAELVQEEVGNEDAKELSMSIERGDQTIGKFTSDFLSFFLLEYLKKTFIIKINTK